MELQFIENTLKRAGEIVLDGFGAVLQVKTKEDQSNILTKVDLASEEYIVREISKRYPEDSIIAEETGFENNEGDYVWIVDPIDGTSNFVANIPWFAVMLARLYRWEVVMAGIYLPAMEELYLAERGRGAYCNGSQIQVSSEENLTEVLVSYGIDYSAETGKTEQELKIIGNIVRNCRNLRSTNSAVDFCYVASGRFGGYINQAAKIWDNAAPYLLIREAGGEYTNISGGQIVFKSDAENYLRNFTYVCAAKKLHPQLLKLIE